jgi:hypothetical protein
MGAASMTETFIIDLRNRVKLGKWDCGLDSWRRRAQRRWQIASAEALKPISTSSWVDLPRPISLYII